MVIYTLLTLSVLDMNIRGQNTEIDVQATSRFTKTSRTVITCIMGEMFASSCFSKIASVGLHQKGTAAQLLPLLVKNSRTLVKNK